MIIKQPLRVLFLCKKCMASLRQLCSSTALTTALASSTADAWLVMQ